MRDSDVVPDHVVDPGPVEGWVALKEWATGSSPATAGTTTRQAGPSEALSMLATRPVRAPPCLTRAPSFARCHSPLSHATARTATERSDWAPKPRRVPKSTAKERKLRQPGRDRGSSRTSVFAGIPPLLERFCSTTENRGVPGSSPGLATARIALHA